jgi:hypothetical protein
MTNIDNIPDDLSFLGNPLLKGANEQIQMTVEQMTEYMKCEEDPVYFIKNYVKIISLDLGVVPFNLWDFQENMVRKMVSDRFVAILTSRQVGKTTVTAAVILWHILFKENYAVAILANKMEQSQEIMGRLQMAYENLPKWIQQGVLIWNKRSMVLENGSSVFASATSSSAIRGRSLNMVYMDEFSHIDRNLQQKFFTSTYPVITAGTETKIIITTTPNGFDLFSKIWFDAKKGKNSYTAIEVHWSEVPGRDEKWKEETIRNTSIQQFRQEHENTFLGSSETLISPEVLGRLTYDDPIRYNNNIKIFQDPVPDHIYVITVDTARGEGGDYSAFVVHDVTEFPYRVAATYKDNSVTPVVYPNYIHHAQQIYNSAHILVEVNDIGGQIADILHLELECDNIMMVAQNGRKGQVMGSIGGIKPRFGVKTTTAVKRIGCFALKGLIEKDELLISDFDILKELTNFVSDGKNYSADVGWHDDLVMCLVLFGWATTQQYFKDLVNSDVRAQILARNSFAIEEDLLPFGEIMNGISFEEAAASEGFSVASSW